ncbi:MAG: FkbM family methyltransferase [Planctomycetota bacterium]|jgi:FkbM family methyltransferase
MDNFTNSHKPVHRVSEASGDAGVCYPAELVSFQQVSKPAQYEKFSSRMLQAGGTRATEHTRSGLCASSRANDSRPDAVAVDDYQFDSEIREQRLVRRIVKAGMTVFDVGAHLGKYTKLFSLLTGDKGRVYAFEPAESSFQKLVSRVSRLIYSNVELFNKAVYSEDRNVMLNQFPEQYSSWNSLGLPKMKKPQDLKTAVHIEKSTEVEAVTLDSFCRRHNIDQIDYLKLDVEGAELDALRGSCGLLENRSVRYLQFEISKPMLKGLNTEAKLVFDFLKSKGYECHSINDDGTVGNVASDSDSFYENYIAFPSETSSAELSPKPQNTGKETGHISGHAVSSKPAACAAGPPENATTGNTTAPATPLKFTHSAEEATYDSFTDQGLWTPQTYMQQAIADWLKGTSFEPCIALSIDKNPPLDVIITRRWPNVKIKRAPYPEFDAQDLSRIADSQYDLVYSNQILEHIPKPWVAAKEMVRVLRPGGLGLHTTCAFNPRHGPPVFNDYYRFLPDGLAELFEGVKVLVKAGWGSRQALLYNLAIDDGHGALGGRRFCEQIGKRNEERYPWHVWIIFEKL